GIKDEEINDPTSCTMWHAHDIKIYLADRFNRRLQFPDLRRAVQSLAERDNPNYILIEDKGSGQQLLQVLQRETRLPVIGVMPKGGKYAESKIARAQGVSGLIESGRVCLPESAPWLVDYESEIAAFPNAPHDDDVDSTTQALKFLSERLHKRVSGETSTNNRPLAAM
ncbi:MAG: phage terminase large subunit, partial [Sulfurimonas sp.]|uniref:phage terminase large subunit n=1 Tax=Sulfurimonas sp. TaxID=2022749 RepID=UPI0025D90360